MFGRLSPPHLCLFRPTTYHGWIGVVFEVGVGGEGQVSEGDAGEAADEQVPRRIPSNDDAREKRRENLEKTSIFKSCTRTSKHFHCHTYTLFVSYTTLKQQTKHANSLVKVRLNVAILNKKSNKGLDHGSGTLTLRSEISGLAI